MDKLSDSYLIFMATVSGEATGKGFYLYDNKRKASPDPELKKYIESSRSFAGVSVDPKVCMCACACSLNMDASSRDPSSVRYLHG